MRAAGLPLVPEKAGAIEAGLDEGVRRARLAENAAQALETAALKRAGEMSAAVGGKGGPAPDAEARDYAAAASAQRARWKTLSADGGDLKKRVDALPDKKDDGKPNEEKRELKNLLSGAASALGDADSALKAAEAATPAMADGAARMKAAQKASAEPAAERARLDAQVAAGAEALPPPVAEAKGRVDLLGREPVELNKTRAWEKLDPLRDRAREIYAAADRACNRADDFRRRSDDFERGRADFDAAKKSGAGAPAAAKSSLDQAEKAQSEVKDRLDHPRP